MVFYSFFDHSTIIYKHSHTITIPISTKKVRMRCPTFQRAGCIFLSIHIIFLKLKGNAKIRGKYFPHHHTSMYEY